LARFLLEKPSQRCCQPACCPAPKTCGPVAAIEAVPVAADPVAPAPSASGVDVDPEADVFIMQGGKVLRDGSLATPEPEPAPAPAISEPQTAEEDPAADVFIMKGGVILRDGKKQ